MHGVNEQVTDDINISVNTVSRIGSVKNNKSRPVLLGFGCEEDKSKLFSNLGVLKEYVDKYLSVVEDSPPEEHHQGTIRWGKET